MSHALLDAQPLMNRKNTATYGLGIEPMAQASQLPHGLLADASDVSRN